MSSRDKDKAQGQFVNDLLRTEFHKYVVFTDYLFDYLILISQEIHVEVCQGELLLLTSPLVSPY